MNRLDELLLAWEERRSRGDSATPEALCPDDPTLREELAAKIRLLEQFEQFFLNSEVPLVREPVEPPLPERVDKYVVARVLGRGGMGVVYLARDPDLGRDVAVKVVDPQRFALSEDAARRFAHEGRVLAQVAHPNIVAVFDSGTCDGQPFLVMEHVQGGNLDKGRARVRAGGPRAVAGLVEKVARAVHFAHAQDPPVLHRDLKPGNILLAADGEPKVADFGLAKLLEPDPPGEVVASPSADTTEVRSQVTVAAGTPAYMAPEQGSVIRARVSAATDVWALGVILHELLTGERPTPGLRPNPDAVAKAVPGRLGRRLAAVAARCLRESPAERFQTADDLADALAEATRPRWPKRLVILVGVLAICGVVWGAVDWSEVRYRQHTAGQNRRLARGEPLRIVAPDIARKPLVRVREGKVATTVRQTPENALRVESNAECSLIEFAEFEPGTEATVRAVIRIDRVLSGKNFWGVYVNHVPTTADGRVRHRLDYAAFTDDPKRTLPAKMYLGELVYSAAPAGLGLQDLYHTGGLSPNASAEAKRDIGETREIVVAIRADVTAWLGPIGNPDFAAGPLTAEHRGLFEAALKRKHGDEFRAPAGEPVRVGLLTRQCNVTVLEFSVIPGTPHQE